MIHKNIYKIKRNVPTIFSTAGPNVNNDNILNPICINPL